MTSSWSSDVISLSSSSFTILLLLARYILPEIRRHFSFPFPAPALPPMTKSPRIKGIRRKRGIWIDTRIPPVKDLLFQPVIFLTLVTPLASPHPSRRLESRSRFNKLDSSNSTPIVHSSVGRFLVLDFARVWSHSAMGIRNLSAQQIFTVEYFS